MNVIHKYPLGIVDNQYINVPANTVPLCIKFQNGALCVWMKKPRYDDGVPDKQMEILIVGTGNECRDDNEPGAGSFKYIGTAFDPVNPLVWHVFWRIY